MYTFFHIADGEFISDIKLICTNNITNGPKEHVSLICNSFFQIFSLLFLFRFQTLLFSCLNCGIYIFSTVLFICNFSHYMFTDFFFFSWLFRKNFFVKNIFQIKNHEVSQITLMQYYQLTLQPSFI